MVLLRVHLTIVFDLIMAQPARPKLPTDRTFLLASPPVVLAPEFGVIYCVFNLLLLFILRFFLIVYIFKFILAAFFCPAILSPNLVLGC